jgi:hypothetical protein
VFRPFNGVSPEQFRQTKIARWADQIGVEVVQVKADVNAPNVAPPVRSGVATAADRLARDAAELATAARTPGPGGRLDALRAGVDRAAGQLVAVTRQDPAAEAATRQALARVRYSVQQLDAAFAEGHRDPAALRPVVIRLSDSLEDQADALRNLTADRAGFDPGLTQAVRGLSAEAKQFSRLVRDTGDLGKARQEYATTLTARWAAVAAPLGKAALPPDVRGQAARVEGVYRRLGRVLAADPGAPPAAPPTEPPPFDPKAGGWRYVPPDPKLGGPGGWVYAPPDPTHGQPTFGFAPRTGGGVFAIGAAVGGGPRVRVFHDPKHAPAADFFAYDPEFRGGVKATVADVNGDGIADIVTAPGPGMPALIRVFDGRDLSLLAEFYGADPSWQGGVNVAVHDLLPDGRVLVAVAPDVGGGPAVKVFDLAAAREVAGFFAFPQELRGGARLAWGDADGDKLPDLLAAPGPCDHAPVVRVFNGRDWKPTADYPAADPRWRGGLWLAAGPGGANGRCLIAVGLDAGGPPEVRVIDAGVGKPTREWLAFPPEFRGGVRVAVGRLAGGPAVDVACAAGPGIPGSPVRLFNARTGRPITDLPAIPDFAGGSFIDAR